MLDGKTKVAVKMIGVAACFHAAAPAFAATSACSALANIAHARVNGSGGAYVIPSNTAETRIDELLDLQLSGVAGLTVAQDQTGSAAFTLTNTGNGSEAFVLGGSIQGVDAAIQGFAIDRNGNGRFDAADLAIATGMATPEVAAGTTLKLLALVRGGAALAQGQLIVQVHAATGTGTPGSVLAGRGDGGACDAVIGGTHASGETSVTLTVAPGTDTSEIQLFKSQTIAAPNGSALPVMGAIVTYTIESRFGGSGVVRSARLADLIPLGTAYVPGSLRLDDTALTDAGDDDAGDFDGAGVRVMLGDVAAPATRRIRFQVRVQ